MRAIVAVVMLMLGGCEQPESAMEQSAPTCSDLREAIVLECEDEAEALADCAEDNIATDDCPEELIAVNDCTKAAKAAHEAGPNLEAARDLAYWCDLNPYVPGLCELAQDDAIEIGVEECPLPERF